MVLLTPHPTSPQGQRSKVHTHKGDEAVESPDEDIDGRDGGVQNHGISVLGY